MKLAVVCLSVLVQQSAADAGTLSEPAGDLNEQIHALLATRDAPVTPQQWRALGPAALPELERSRSRCPGNLSAADLSGKQWRASPRR